MDDLKPLTDKEVVDLKEGDKLLRINNTDYGMQRGVFEGKVYTFKGKHERNTNMFYIREASALMSRHNFALADRRVSLANIANKGRIAANELLDKYADSVKIKDGKYIIQD